LEAWCVVHSDGEVSGEVVVAVAWLTDTVGAADDDVGLEGLAGAESTVEIVGRTGEDSSSGVVCVLGAGDGSRGNEESSVHHFESRSYVDLIKWLIG
jgi:hypothetical protein